MTSPEGWVKLLYTYGPFALAVLLLLVAENKARRAWRAAPTNEKKVLVAVYCATWLAFFAVGLFAMYAWKRINLPREFTIHGTLRGKPSFTSEMVTSDSGLYVRRVYDAGGFHYEWRIITERRLPDNSGFVVVFDAGSQTHEQGAQYQLTILPGFYDSTVNIVYDRGRGRLMLQYGGKESDLPSSPLFGRLKPRRRAFVSIAYAQEPFVPERFRQRLESDDPIVRRDGRTALAKQGSSALPWIDSVLAAAGSSYRLRLGVIVALNQMAGSVPALSSGARLAVTRAAQDVDPTLSAEARKLKCRLGPAC